MEIEHIRYPEDNRPPLNAAFPSANKPHPAKGGAVAALARPSSASATITGTPSIPSGRRIDGGHQQQALGSSAAGGLWRMDVELGDGGDSAPEGHSMGPDGHAHSDEDEALGHGRI
jgi:hypothetical protein